MKNLIRFSLVALLSLAASGAAMAQHHGGYHGGGHGHGPGWHGHHGWHGGGWRGGYRGFYGPRFGFYGGFPLGYFTATLPFGYSSVWVGGAPYYYANGTYWAPASGGYTVVEPPQQIVAQAPAAAPAVAPAPAPAPIYYPRNGQSASSTEADRRECNTWATTQPSAMADASVFQRAVMACMEGRGYTVK